MEIDVTVHDQAEKNYKSYHLKVEDKLLLGRGPDSPIPFSGTQLSRDHFSLRVVENTLYVEDLSANGTHLNNALLAPGTPRVVSPSDSIHIPGFEIIIDSLGEHAAAPQVVHDAGQQSARLPAPPASALEPVRKLWRGLNKVERLVIYSTIACIALVIAYYQSN